ncbi:ribosomal large subunit pseudouridine synthase B, partial [Metamycoplasma alkalescens]
MDKKIKIQKRISEMGFCSRREAENLIKEKKVYVNNQIAVIGQRVFFDDEIKINNQILKNQNQKFYILLNKPRNTICTLKDPQNRQTIYQW